MAWECQDHAQLEQLWTNWHGHDLTEGACLISLSCGQGGKEAQSWKKELCILFLAWCDKAGFEAELVDDDDQGTTLRVENERALSFFKTQEGVHRFIRQSPFDKNQKIHTSYVQVMVEEELPYPSVEDIEKKDVEMSFMRSSGAGGQHVNKTESAVRLKHIPTGITVVCRQGRSQHMNRKIAWTLLQRKILEQTQQQNVYQKETMDKVYTYHFGQNRVTNHRTQQTFVGCDMYLAGKTLPCE